MGNFSQRAKAMQPEENAANKDTIVDMRPFLRTCATITLISQLDSNTSEEFLQFTINDFSTLNTIQKNLEQAKNCWRFQDVDYVSIIIYKKNIFDEWEKTTILTPNDSLTINALIKRHKSNDFEFQNMYQ